MCGGGDVGAILLISHVLFLCVGYPRQRELKLVVEVYRDFSESHVSNHIERFQKIPQTREFSS